jgi:signal transduction histidine kinase
LQLSLLNRHQKNFSLHSYHFRSLNQLLFIETFVLGASAIAGTYHLMLFIQQREKYLLAYSIYLFSLASYIGFKLLSNNYNPYFPTAQAKFYFIEEFLQIGMVCIYASFAAITLNVTRKDKYVMALWILILSIGTISIAIHIHQGVGTETVQTPKLRYAISRFSIIGLAALALILVWQTRKTTFQRTIIFGSFVYAFAGFMSALSFTVDGRFMGLAGVEPYLVGCLIDIIIFSSAFGYRIKQIALEKNQLLKAELDNQLAMSHMRSNIASNLHDDVGSTLSSISIYSEAVKNSILSKDENKALSMLKILGTEARETISNMSDIVWAINPRNDSIDRLIARMNAYAADVCKAKGTELVMDIQHLNALKECSMAFRNNLFLIFKECVNNSLKYSAASKIIIRVTLQNEKPVLIFEDNGRGFEYQDEPIEDYASDSLHDLKGGNGIPNMKARAHEIGAKLLIRSSIGEGTSLRLELK